MNEMSRRRALKAVASGRAHVLNLKTWAPVALQEAVGRPIQVVVFPRVRAVSEVKLGYGRRNGRILKRDGYRCQYDDCKNRGTTVDHVIPRCQGGQSTWQNLVACCSLCNTRKGGRTPLQAGMVLKSPIMSRKGKLMEKFQLLAGAA